MGARKRIKADEMKEAKKKIAFVTLFLNLKKQAFVPEGEISSLWYGIVHRQKNLM